MVVSGDVRELELYYNVWKELQIIHSTNFSIDYVHWKKVHSKNSFEKSSIDKFFIRHMNYFIHQFRMN